MYRCPNCRKRIQDGSAVQCPHCKFDIALLVKLRELPDAHFNEALLAYEKGEYESAVRAASAAAALNDQDREAQELLAMALEQALAERAKGFRTGEQWTAGRHWWMRTLLPVVPVVAGLVLLGVLMLQRGAVERERSDTQPEPVPEEVLYEDNESAPVEKETVVLVRIMAGDSYSSLAMRFYGRASKWTRIATENPDHPNPLQLPVGAWVRIPIIGSPVSESEADARISETEEDDGASLLQ